jgi:hypothetical protein
MARELLRMLAPSAARELALALVRELEGASSERDTETG